MENEKEISDIIKSSIKKYAWTFSDRHISERNNPFGTINMKKNNLFTNGLGKDFMFYSALSQSLNSSIGKMIEMLGISIATLHYDVSQEVEGPLFDGQVCFIAELMEKYKNHDEMPEIKDYKNIVSNKKTGNNIIKKHISDYHLRDKKTGKECIIELKLGGNLDIKKANSEKTALLEQYCILTNKKESETDTSIYFATAYNMFGENNQWKQNQVRQFFSADELLISKDFWNLICASPEGFDFVFNEYENNIDILKDNLMRINEAYNIKSA